MTKYRTATKEAVNAFASAKKDGVKFTTNSSGATVLNGIAPMGIDSPKNRERIRSIVDKNSTFCCGFYEK